VLLLFTFQQQQHMAVEGGREMDYNDQFDESSGSDFNSQMPFSFRVQPMQLHSLLQL